MTQAETNPQRCFPNGSTCLLYNWSAVSTAGTPYNFPLTIHIYTRTYIYIIIYNCIYSEIKYMKYSYIYNSYIYIYIYYSQWVPFNMELHSQLLGSRLGTAWQLRSCWQLLAQAHGGSSFINDEWLTTMVIFY
jgi:hypothetical protein